MAPSATAADSIKVGQTAEVSISYLPTYIAMDTGIFRDEGLEVTFVVKDHRELTAAGVSGAIDIVPDTGGAEAAIKGAPVRYVVGQSLVSPWVIVADNDSINVAEDLKGKTLGFGTPGKADYEVASHILQQYFGMIEGRDYRAVSIAREPDRLAALVKGDVQAALMSFRQAAKAGVEGYGIVLKSGYYLPRLNGAYWVTASYLEKNQDRVRRFIRAIARATLYLTTNQMGSLAVIRKRFGINNPAEANVLWTAVHREFDPNIADGLIRQMFGETLAQLRRKGLWPKSRPMPAAEQFVARGVMQSALREIGY